jgi:4-hydroxy-2-oxoheptanedioate aldolase
MAGDALDLAGMLRADELCCGTLMVSTHPAFAAAACGGGALDFVFLDTEHVPLDRGALAQACALYRARGVPPLVRIPKADATLARAVVDAGACGVVASYLCRCRRRRRDEPEDERFGERFSSDFEISCREEHR